MRFAISLIGQALVGVALATAAFAQPVQPPPPASAPVSALLAASPTVSLTNGRIAARVARIDAARGFYNGTRFDQAGVITSLTIGGKEFYGPWFERTAPDVLDYTSVGDTIVAGPDSAVSGPVEEFAPLGFEARRGLFAKIGVGVLYQPDTQAYDHYRHYRILDAGQHTTTVTKTGVTFTQTLVGALSNAGYGYVYEKSLKLIPGKPQLMITHRLRNTGTRTIRTTVYDHNFLRLVPGNGSVTVTFPFSLAADNPPAADLIRIRGQTLSYLRPMAANERISFPVTGFGKTATDYDFKIEDTVTGAGVRVRGDQPLTRINIFSIDRVQSVEPYIAIELAPGAEKSWSYTYSFSGPRKK
jgi:hypothetical protein